MSKNCMYMYMYTYILTVCHISVPLANICIHIHVNIVLFHSVGYFPSVEQGYSLTLFLVCVLVVVAVAALSCKKTDTVSGVLCVSCDCGGRELIDVCICVHFQFT